MPRFIACFMVVLLVGCGQAVSTSEVEAPAIEVITTAAEFNADGAPTVEFSAPGMHCEVCAAGVCDALREQPGVVDVKADAEKKVVTVAVEQASFEPATVIDAIAEANFGEATLVEEATEATAPEAEEAS